MSKPQSFAHPEALAAVLTYKNTELINRAPIGISELGGVLLNLQQLIHDGLEKKVLHPEFAARWQALFTRFNLQEAAETLNSNDYPMVDRSAVKIQQAVKSVLQLGNHIREHWGDFAIVLGVASALTVDTVWLAKLAALTHPGAWAEKLSDVPSAVEDAKQALLANPTRGKGLVDFLTAEIQNLHGVRNAAAPVAAGPAASGFVPLAFSDDESVEPADQAQAPAPDPVVAVRASADAILQMEFPTGRGDAPPSTRKVRRFSELLESNKNDFEAKYNSAGAAGSDMSVVDAREITRQVKRLRREITSHAQNA